MVSPATLQYLTSIVDATVEQHYIVLLKNGDVVQFIAEKYGTIQENNEIPEVENIIHSWNNSSDKVNDKLNELIKSRITLISGIKEETAIVSDLLMVIFAVTNSADRERYFHILIHQYFINYNQCCNRKLNKFLSSQVYEEEIYKLLPQIKFDTAVKLVKDNNKESSELLSSLLVELKECLLNKDFYREDCYKIVKKLNCGDKKYSLMTYQLLPFGSRNGYLGDYYNLTLKLLSDNNNEETVELFAKYLPTTNEAFREIARRSFQKEQFIYDVFFYKLSDLGYSKLMDVAPKCFFARNNTILVLENLAAANYVGLDSISLPEFESFLIPIKLIAKFHAGSLVFEEKMTKINGELYRLDDEYNDYFQEMLYTDYGAFNVHICSLRCVFDYFLPTKFPKSVEDLFKRSFNAEEFFKKYSKSNKYRNVICQGDLWPTNVLYHKEQKLSRLVDYQLTRYCPPCLDLLFFLYFVLTKETRQKYMSLLLEEYHRELGRILQDYDMNIEKIHSYSSFIESCNELKDAGIWQALEQLQIILCPKNVLPNDSEILTEYFMKDRCVSKQSLEDAWKNEAFRSKVVELIEELAAVYEEQEK